jgi:hypothetical protein
MSAEPFGTANGNPFATTLSRPDLTLATFTTDGPPGAEALLYLKSVPDAFALQKPSGRLNVTGVPSFRARLSEESDPPLVGSEPPMEMVGSFEIRTSFAGPFNRSFLPVMPWSVARALPASTAVCRSIPARLRRP